MLEVRDSALRGNIPTAKLECGLSLVFFCSRILCNPKENPSRESCRIIFVRSFCVWFLHHSNGKRSEALQKQRHHSYRLHQSDSSLIFTALLLTRYRGSGEAVERQRNSPATIAQSSQTQYNGWVLLTFLISLVPYPSVHSNALLRCTIT